MAEGFVRPEALVLPANALVPNENLIWPPPNLFTHVLARVQPYFYGAAADGGPADGELAAGTRVVLLVYEGGSACRVVDGRGLYVEVEYAALRRLKRVAKAVQPSGE